MSEKNIDINKIARLAQLKIPENEITNYQEKLSSVIEWFQMLEEVNTENIDIMISPFKEQLEMREDISKETNETDVLSNAKDNTVYNYFTVPKVLK